MAFPYLEAVVGFMIFMYFVETYLDLRQHAALKLPHLPRPLEGVVSKEKFEKSRAYSIDKSRFHFVHAAVTIIGDSLILLLRVLPWLWQKSEGIVTMLGLDPQNEIIHTLGFLAVITLWSQFIDLPFSLYSTFIIEARHGFNKQTILLFFRDMVVSLCLTVLLGPPVIAAMILIVQKGGPYLAIYLWVFMLILSLVMMSLYPILIAPLFNKFTPLPEGVLRSNIERLASSLKFPLRKLFVIDGSTRSTHSNAYMYGFYNNKRIVIYDTLIQQCKDEEEVVAVIAHELGHWKLNHTMYSFIAMQVASKSSTKWNWSTYGFIHFDKRNRLASKKAEDLVFLHSNLLLPHKFEDYKKEPNKLCDILPKTTNLEAFASTLPQISLLGVDDDNQDSST